MTESTRWNRLIRAVKSRPRTITAIVLGLLCALDWVIADRWQARGLVVDSTSNAELSSAWVLVKFDGESPLIRLPIPPHPLDRTSRCMGVHLIRTDEQGRFEIDELTPNRALANKSAHATVFRPGWIPVTMRVPLRTSIFALVPQGIRVPLARGPGARHDNARSWAAENLRTPVDTQDLSYSDEFFATIRVLSRASSACESEASEMFVAAMSHALDIAVTLDERDRLRAMCLLASDHLAPSGRWPFDCENLRFKYQPSGEVLKAEAEIAARRSAPRARNP